ncbi:hypothetical protein AOQ84DRAFT_417297, partial [Glonium stellatum]
MTSDQTVVSSDTAALTVSAAPSASTALAAAAPLWQTTNRRCSIEGCWRSIRNRPATTSPAHPTSRPITAGLESSSPTSQLTTSPTAPLIASPTLTPPSPPSPPPSSPPSPLTTIIITNTKPRNSLLHLHDRRRLHRGATIPRITLTPALGLLQNPPRRLPRRLHNPLDLLLLAPPHHLPTPPLYRLPHTNRQQGLHRIPSIIPRIMQIPRRHIKRIQDGAERPRIRLLPP